MGRSRRPRQGLSRRERLDARLQAALARVERARARSLVVDALVRVVRRERPVAVGILAAALAFRVFALMIPLAYVLVAGLGLGASPAPGVRRGRGEHLGDLFVESVSAAARTSDRGRVLALVLGGGALLLAGSAVVEVLRWVHLLAWRLPAPRGRGDRWVALALVAGAGLAAAGPALVDRARAATPGVAAGVAVTLALVAAQFLLLSTLWLGLSWVMPRPAEVPWTALVPGAMLFAGGFLAFNLAVTLYFAPRAARASAVYGSLGVALVLLVSLFLVGRLAVAAAELNATLWERRRGGGRR